MREIWKTHKSAIIFLLVFIGIYLVFNSSYGFYINYYAPDADPLTILVTRATVFFLNLLHGDFTYTTVQGSIMVPIFYNYLVVLEVFEGCNGLNVMIVFIAFIFAFKGPLNWTLIYLLLGFLAISVMNILRLVLLTEVALNFPDYFYFVHKYLFTGCIYAVVFIIWFFWVKKVQMLKIN